MNRITKYILTALTALLALAAICAGLFWLNWQKNDPASVESVSIPKGELKIGMPIKVTAIIRTPWYRQIQEPVTFTGSTEIEISSNSSIYLETADLSGSLWQLQADIIAFKEGIYKDLEFIVGLSADKNGKQNNLTISLPEVTVKSQSIDKNQAIAMQDNLDEAVFKIEDVKVEQSDILWLWVALAVVILAAIFFALRNKQSTKIKLVSAWDEAAGALKALEQEQNLNDERFFVRLSDILRLYIQKRFKLPATEKTSQEFIVQVRNENLLKEEHKRSLENFLSTADMVKFAKMAADSKQRQDCLNMAGTFVKETIPRIPEGAS